MRSCLLILVCIATGCASPQRGGVPKERQEDLEWLLRAEPTLDLHPNPKVGKYWELTTFFSDGVSRRAERWVVSREVEDCLIVELQVTYSGPEIPEPALSATAYLVEAAGGDSRVLRAWEVFIASEPPTEVYVSRTPRKPKDPRYLPKLDEELEFREEHLGRTFHGKVRRYSWGSYDPEPKEFWIAEDGWFDGRYGWREVRKNGSTGTRCELTAIGTDGESWIDWEGVDIRAGYMLDTQWSVVPR
jgi:hypothetical protein